MVFTLISIFLSAVEYLFSRKSVKSEHIMIISYVVDSPYFGNMKEGAFLFKVMFKPRKVVHAMYTLLGISRSNIERLMPLQLKNGAVFTFFIEYSSERKYQKIEAKMTDGIIDNALESKFCEIYQQNKRGSDCNKPFEISINSLTIKQMEPPPQSKFSQWLDSQCDACFGTRKTTQRKNALTQQSRLSSDFQLTSQQSGEFTIGSHSPTVESPRLEHGQRDGDVDFNNMSPFDTESIPHTSTQVTAAPSGNANYVE